MADVKRSVVLAPHQDAFIDRVAARLERNRSWVVRHAVERLMSDPAFFVDTIPPNGGVNSIPGKELAHA